MSFTESLTGLFRPGRSVPEPPAPEDRPDMSVSDVFEILQNKRRALVIEDMYHNYRPSGVATTADLTDYVAAIENNGIVDCQERKNVRVALYQHHLDQLVDVGALERLGTHEYKPGPNLEIFAETLEDGRANVLEYTGGGQA